VTALRRGPQTVLMAMLLALATAGVLTIPVLRGAETGTVVFRVTLRGEVPSGDAFSVYRVADPAQWVDSSQGVCNPPDWSADPRAQQPTCTATTYETSVTGAVGARVDYSLLRDPAGQPVAFEEHQAGSLTIEPGTQVVTLTYTYASPPPAPGSPDAGSGGAATGTAPATGATATPPATGTTATAPTGGATALLPDTAVPRRIGED
jgi:hypothetical protein